MNKPIKDMTECELVYRIERCFSIVEPKDLYAYSYLTMELLERFGKYYSQYSLEKRNNLILEYHLLVKE